MLIYHQGVVLERKRDVRYGYLHLRERDQLARGDVLGGSKQHLLMGARVIGEVLGHPVRVPHLFLELDLGPWDIAAHPLASTASASRCSAVTSPPLSR